MSSPTDGCTYKRANDHNWAIIVLVLCLIATSFYVASVVKTAKAPSAIKRRARLRGFTYVLNFFVTFGICATYVHIICDTTTPRHHDIKRPTCIRVYKKESKIYKITKFAKIPKITKYELYNLYIIQNKNLKKIKNRKFPKCRVFWRFWCFCKTNCNL